MHPGYLASSMQRLQKALTRTAMRLQDQTLFPPLHLRMTRVGDLEVPPRRLHPGPRRLVLDAMSLRSYGRGSGGGIIGRPRRDSDASAAFKKKSFALFNEQRQVFCFGDTIPGRAAHSNCVQRISYFLVQLPFPLNTSAT